MTIIETHLEAVQGAPEKDGNSADSDLDEVQSEVDDHEASLKSYDVLTYPADFTLEVLVDKWRKGDIVIPGFQRLFVWSRTQSSKLIESFLRGLPVPSIFLFADLTTNKLLVVDGHQRLKSIAFFFDGHFGDEQGAPRIEFCLKGLEDGSPFEGLSYKEIRRQHPTAFGKLNNSVLRSFVIKQLDPKDDTSVYHIFERLNTGGTQLSPQEIRNCVHHGRFNELLVELNEFEPWRRILGRAKPDRRQRDVELILRFLALAQNSSSYKKPMKDFLNRFMGDQKLIDDAQLHRCERLFMDTASLIAERLGDAPFHIRRSGLNAAVFDCVFVAIARNLSSVPDNLDVRYRRLVSDGDFRECVTSATTDVDIVAKRLELAAEALG